jgi:uncharacterized protein (DUF362 family)
MKSVSIIHSSVEPDKHIVYDMVEKAIDHLGGIESIVKSEDIVALKPNVVTGELSGPGVTTDPRVVEVLIKLCQDAGAGEVYVVEGAGYFTETSKALKLSGILDLSDRNGALVVDVDKEELIEVEVPNPLLIDKVKVSKIFMEADVRINIPVMKTHDQLLVTLGVKNLKGVIPKSQKREFHRLGVVKAIIDLSKAVKIDLTVLDAIVAMEGLGPSFGPKIRLNTIMASKDIWNLDLVASKIMGFKSSELDYIMEASAHGLLDLTDNIDVLGTPVSKVTRRFERPPTDLQFANEVTVISEGACSACRGTIHSVLYDLEQMKMMGEIRDLFIIVGPNAEMPDNLPNTPIIMGRCQMRNEEKGYYVAGCPPNNDKMLAAIREVCKIQN